MLAGKRNSFLIAAGLALVALACSDNDLLGPSLGDPIQFSREISLGELQDALATTGARLDIQLFEDGMVARRVVVRKAEAFGDEERIESRATAIQASDTEGTLSLRLGSLTVGFDHETHFRGPGGDAIGYGDFVERVTLWLGDGFQPVIVAERAPGDLPQDPADASFFPASLRALEEGDGPALALNVDADNLELNGSPQAGEPDAWLDVLGLRIELRISDGVTELASEDADVADEVEFEGFVKSVDLEGHRFTFTDGTVVNIVETTAIADGPDFLASLEAVKAAFEDGLKVVAWGCGSLVSAEPRVIDAGELHFVLHDGGGDANDIVEFEGHVVSVDVDAGSFTLTNGTIVKITGETELIHTGDGQTLGSLQEAKDSLDAGADVIAYGAGKVETAEPLVLIALEMRFVIPGGGGNTESFEGAVASVDLIGDGSFTLANGIVVLMTADTQIKQAEQGQALMSLSEVKSALDGGHNVVAWGSGNVEGTEPLTIAALEVYFVQQ